MAVSKIAHDSVDLSIPIRAALIGLEIINNNSNNRNPTLKHMKLEKRQSRGPKRELVVTGMITIHCICI